MKIHIIFWLFLLLEDACASDAALPYELLWFYGAYKMEFKTRPLDTRDMARGCVHVPLKVGAGLAAEQAFIATTEEQGVEGICAFDEFVRHIGGPQFEKWYSSVKGWSLTPDPADAAIKAAAVRQANGKALRYDTSRLHRVLAAIKQQPVSQTSAFKSIAITAQTSRGFASGLNLVTVNQAVADASDYLRIIREYRSKEQFPFLQAFLVDNLKASPLAPYLVPETVSIIGHDGSTLDTYSRYDFAAIIDTAEKAGVVVTDDMKNGLIDASGRFATTADTTAGAKLARAHQNILVAVADTHAMMTSPVSAGC